MCVLSMVMDAKSWEWEKRYPNPLVPAAPLPTKEEIEEFRRLLERARQYDREHGQPDCELEEKRKKLKDLAKELGVEIEFV